jgi:hypothetical protein
MMDACEICYFIFVWMFIVVWYIEINQANNEFIFQSKSSLIWVVYDGHDHSQPLIVVELNAYLGTHITSQIKLTKAFCNVGSWDLGSRTFFGESLNIFDCDQFSNIH